jgi:hypothetical protein
MKRSNTAVAAIGKPFAKGEDQRRNMHGQKNKEAVEITAAMKAAFAEEGARGDRFRKVVDKVWEKAALGVPWAVQMVMDRVLGRVKESVEVSTPTDRHFTIKVVEVKQ